MTTIQLRDSLVLLPCVKSKRSSPTAARTLYTSTLFTLTRDLAERQEANYRILSALHGLLKPDQVIAPYEFTLKGLGVQARREWASRVLVDLLPEAKLVGRVIFFAGESYREFLVGPLRETGVEIDVPMKGHRQGEQLQWLTRQQ